MLNELIPNILIYLTLISDLVILGIFIYWIALIFKRKKLSSTRIGAFLNKNYLLFGFIVSLTAMLGSLFYSDVLGYQPCVFCWYQRIFMYSQVFIFAFALWKKDKKIAPYSILLSLLGGLIAFYHYVLQVGWVGDASVCAVIEYSISCTENFFTYFGYITIPMMSATAFVLLTILGANARR